jgi:hypothetical protein
MRNVEIDCTFGCCADCCKKHIRDPSDCPEHGTRLFGSFKCKCGKSWKSAFACKGWKQRCNSCLTYVYGYSFVAHSGTSVVRDSEKPHDSAGCELCCSGRPCKRGGGVVSTSRHVSQYGGNDNNSHYDYDYDYDDY